MSQKKKKQKKTNENYYQKLATFAESADRKKTEYKIEENYECKFCGQQFENGNKLDEHLKMH